MSTRPDRLSLSLARWISSLLLTLWVSGAIGADSLNVMPLMDDWRWASGDGTGPTAWQPMTLPHAVVRGPDGNEIIPAPTGPSMYERDVILPPCSANQRYELVIERAMWHATVQWDGHPLGETGPGWATSVLPIPAQAPGSRHGLHILVDPRVPTTSMPQYRDFPWHGGLVGSVGLRVVSDIRFPDQGVAGSNPWFTTLTVAPDHAEVRMSGVVANASGRAEDAQVTVTILGADGSTVGSTHVLVSGVLPGGSTSFSQTLSVTAPRLWQGRRDPFRYRTRCAVVVNGIERDVVTGWLGIRTVEVDAQRGFILNGEPYRLRSVGVHRGVPGRGLAESPGDWDTDIALLEEVGATAVRLVHMPHPQGFLDRLDAHGFIAWSEIPLYKQIPSTPAGAEAAEIQLTTMVSQFRHHPAIACWGLFNEIPDTQANQTLIRRLHQRAKEMDPGRFTTGASGQGEMLEINLITDAMAFIRFLGWYMPGPPAFDDWARFACSQDLTRPIGIAEYGASAVAGRRASVTEVRSTGYPMAWPEAFSDDYQAALHAEAWKQLKNHADLWITSVWVLADFRSDLRLFKPNPIAGYNIMGLVTADRQHRKPAFHVLSALWRDDPILVVDAAAPAKVPGVALISNCSEVVVTDVQTGSERRTVLPGVQSRLVLSTDELAHGVVLTGHRGDATSRASIEGVVIKSEPTKPNR